MLKRRSPISKEVRRLGDERGGELAERRAAPGLADELDGAAGNHRGAGEPHVARFADFGRRVTKLGGMLLNRERLAGQQRLVNEEIAARQQHSIGRHHVAGGKSDDVARDQLGDWQAGVHTVSAYVRPQCHLLTQCVDRILSLVGLREVKQH